MQNLACFLALLAAVPACVSDADIEQDGRDDSFADGKGDSAGIVDGSPQAIGVLRVANERSKTELVDHGVPARAAQNIVAVRLGDDESMSTADDVAFASISQLDAVPYVGPVAFARMLAYATSLGYVPVTTAPSITPPADLWNVDESCPPMLFAPLAAKFPAGETRYEFPVPFVMVARHRDSCNAVTGCTPWQPDGIVTSYSFPDYAPPSGPRKTVRMTLDPDRGRITFAMEGLNGPDLSYSCSDIAVGDGLGNSGRPVITCIAEPKVSDTAMFDPGWAHGDSRIYLAGTICADGRFHFRTKLASELGLPVTYTTNRNQIAIYGQL